MLVARPDKARSWFKTNGSELTKVELAAVTGVETPYQTLLVAASLVDQTIWAEEPVVLVADSPEMTGGVTSGAVKVINDPWVEVAVFPAASAEVTR